MSILVLRAFWKLVYFDVFLAVKDFSTLYSRVREHPISRATAFLGATERICAAADMACIWYWKEVLCLQRSAATVCLLRTYGVPAQMLIGVQQVPFRAHAWVEVDGRIVNDKPYMRELYAVLDQL